MSPHGRLGAKIWAWDSGHEDWHRKLWDQYGFNSEDNTYAGSSNGSLGPPKAGAASKRSLGVPRRNTVVPGRGKKTGSTARRAKGKGTSVLGKDEVDSMGRPIGKSKGRRTRSKDGVGPLGSDGSREGRGISSRARSTNGARKGSTTEEKDRIGSGQHGLPGKTQLGAGNARSLRRNGELGLGGVPEGDVVAQIRPMSVEVKSGKSKIGTGLSQNELDTLDEDDEARRNSWAQGRDGQTGGLPSDLQTSSLWESGPHENAENGVSNSSVGFANATLLRRNGGFPLRSMYQNDNGIGVDGAPGASMSIRAARQRAQELKRRDHRSDSDNNRVGSWQVGDRPWFSTSETLYEDPRLTAAKNKRRMQAKSFDNLSQSVQRTPTLALGDQMAALTSIDMRHARASFSSKSLSKLIEADDQRERQFTFSGRPMLSHPRPPPFGYALAPWLG